MESSTSRIIIETVVQKTLRELRDSPERSVRNLVDMALHFAEGRFQRNFFRAAQTMLQNEHSPYYALIEDTAAHVDPQRIFRFGMNLGYNGCTLGAKTIRELEEKEQYNIPWMLTLGLDSRRYSAYQRRYQAVVSQGERLGVYTWLLLPKGRPLEALPLVQEHPDSAFVLFCRPEELTPCLLDGVSQLPNLMLAVRYGEDAAQACGLLRKAELLYSVYAPYGREDVESIRNGDLFSGAEQLHPLFTILFADSGCPAGAREAVYQAVREAREQQLFQTIPWEAACDCGLVDGVISNDACLAGFDAEGQLFTPEERKTGSCYNLLQNDLSRILKLAFPKTAPAS